MNQQQSYKNVPPFTDPALLDTYLQELEVWQIVTDLAPEKQGAAVALSLPLGSKARQSVLAAVPKAELIKATGFSKVVAALKKTFNKDSAQNALTCFDAFIKFKRPDSMPIQDYLVEFNLLLNKVTGHKAVLPDPMLAYFVLENANLSEEKKALCRATCQNLTYEDMKTIIEKVNPFESPSNTQKSGNSSSQLDVVQFYTEDGAFYENQAASEFYENEDYCNDAGDQEYVFQHQEQPTEPTHQHPQQQHTEVVDTYYAQNNHMNNRSNGNGRTNPPDETGRPSSCGYCKSIYHWIQNCPHAPRDHKSGRGRGGFVRRPFRGGFRGNARGVFNNAPRKPFQPTKYF